jgi:primosomal protein N'
MFVIDVIPFSKSAPAGTLSYRSKVELAPGSLVRVMLRKTATQALVVSCESVMEQKSTLKRATFMLSKSEPVLEGSIPLAYISAAKEIALYHASPLGSVLMALFADLITADVSFVDDASATEKKASDTGVKKLNLIEGTFQSRTQHYRSLIETAMSSRASVHLLVPTLAEFAYWKVALKDLSPLCISSETPPKRRAELLQKAGTHVGGVITTPSYIGLPLPLRTAYILERVSAGTYQLPKRPYLDTRMCARAFSASLHTPLYIGDYPIPLEYRNGAQKLPTLHSKLEIFDARKKDDQIGDDVPWKALPDQLIASIKTVLDTGGRVAVLAVRKGYAPAVVCKDCGQAVLDERGYGMSFSQEGGKRVMRSSDGKSVREADTKCVRCDSWNLLPLGIGVERIEEELAQTFLESPLVTISAEAIRKSSEAKKILAQAELPGAIIIGTEAMLLWLQGMHEKLPITLGIVASSDSLLALPFWRARERFSRLGLLFASLTTTLIIATRKPDNSIFSTFTNEHGVPFFTEELMLRKALGYPPFGTLITLQSEGTHTHNEKVRLHVATLLADRPISTLPERAMGKNMFRQTFVLQYGNALWPDTALSHTLMQLQLTTRILLDPESLW